MKSKETNETGMIASSYVHHRMTKERAEQIITWRYEAPLEIYSFDNSQETLKELLDDGYYVVVDETTNRLIGFFCIGKHAQLKTGRVRGYYDDAHFMDIGIGMHPQLVGKGLGFAFFSACLRFADEALGHRLRFRLSVQSDNHQAIRVYKKAGFHTVKSFVAETKCGELEFLIMEKA